MCLWSLPGPDLYVEDVQVADVVVRCEPNHAELRWGVAGQIRSPTLAEDSFERQAFCTVKREPEGYLNGLRYVEKLAPRTVVLGNGADPQNEALQVAKRGARLVVEVAGATTSQVTPAAIPALGCVDRCSRA